MSRYRAISADGGAVLDLLAGLVPRDVPIPADLDRDLDLLGVERGARTVVRASYAAGLLLAAVGVAGIVATLGIALFGATLKDVVPSAGPGTLAASLDVSALGLGAGLGAVCTGFALPVAVPAVVRWLGDARRASAMGAAPALVSRVVLRMRIEPSVEAAAVFAARTGSGPLAADLERRVRRARSEPGSGLGAFGEAWGDRFPALRRATMLVTAAGDAPPGERDRNLDRAMAAVLDGTHDRAAAFAAALGGPATAIYAFGVLLPLALVAVLPAARVAGLAVSLPVVVAIYDVLLPGGLVMAGAWLLARRPTAFPAPSLPADHPDVSDVRKFAPVLALGIGVAAWLVVPVVLPGWAAPLAAAGACAGTALVGWYWPVVRVTARVRAVEAGLPDALYLVGRRVSDGHAVETAVEHASDELDGPTGDVFTAATRRGRQLRVGVREAFVGEHGALATVPSPRTRSTADLLGTAAREGRPAGRAVVAMADHLEDLRAVERDARREIGSVTATLANTAAVFGPLVGGVTVALADAMGGRTFGLGAVTAGPGGAGPGVGAPLGAATALPTAGLGLAVGAYVLVLSAILTALATGLEGDLDRVTVGYRVGLALLSSTTVYLAAFAGASLLT